MTDKRTVALVGMATSNRHLAPFDDESVEIWTLNESPAKRFGYVTRVTRHFQLHPRWNFMRTKNQNDPEHYQWLRVQEFPIYMQEVHEDIPTSVEYPLDAIFDKFKIPLEGPDHWREFDSTFPYMLALALYEEVDKIDIYGFEMGSETEYSGQRPNVHLWLGMARMSYLLTGKPEIYIPDDCKLLGWGQPLYGYEMVYDSLNPMEVEIYRNKYGNQAKQLSDQILKIEGEQKAIQEQVANINKHFQGRADALKQKKQDPKLTQRRLVELEAKMNETLKPLLIKDKGLQNEKMNLWALKERNTGGHQAMQEILDRHNSQRFTGDVMGKGV